MEILNDTRQGLKKLERIGKCWYLMTDIQKLWNKLGGKFPHNYWSIKSCNNGTVETADKIRMS